MDYIVHKPF